MSVANLERKPAVVIAMRPPLDDPCMVVGFSPNSPLGPAVAIGASIVAQGQGLALALVAHIGPDEALELAKKLKSYARECRSALGGKDWNESAAAFVAAAQAPAEGRPN